MSQPDQTKIKQTRLSAGYVRSKMPANRVRKANSLALLIFAADLICYFASFWLIIFAPYLPLKIIAVALHGLFIGALFVIGHDACHGSYTSKNWLNQIVGRISLIPTLNAFSAWDVSHNQCHHGYTNLKGLEDVYVPLSKAEYDNLSKWGKLIQRFYRTPIGVVFYYKIEVWLKRMIFPRQIDFKRMSAKLFYFDTALLAGYVSLQIVVLIYLTPLIAAYFNLSTSSFLTNYLMAVVVPFAIWVWLYVTVTMLHHTHPQVPWFDNKTEWNFFRAQVEASVHILVPTWLRLITNNVFEHTAHHVDVRIPLYNLKDSQKALRTEFPNAIRTQTGMFFSVFRTLKVCKLYDYKNHCWTDFKGNVTSRIEQIDLKSQQREARKIVSF